MSTDAARHRDPRRHDIVYRDLPSSRLAPQACRAAAGRKHRETHMADPVLLFRYSALTFNGHRIHYDRDYVTKVEGYPGLIFHGPMQAALQIDSPPNCAELCRRNSAIAACSRCSKALSSRSMPTRRPAAWRRGRRIRRDSRP